MGEKGLPVGGGRRADGQDSRARCVGGLCGSSKTMRWLAEVLGVACGGAGRRPLHFRLTAARGAGHLPMPTTQKRRHLGSCADDNDGSPCSTPYCVCNHPVSRSPGSHRFGAETDALPKLRYSQQARFTDRLRHLFRSLLWSCRGVSGSSGHWGLCGQPESDISYWRTDV